MQQTPHLYNVTIKDSDWANPISLAAIKGISIDFFSPFYSDVSFQRFRVPNNKISIYSLPLHFKKILTGSHGGDSIPDIDIPRYIRLINQRKMTLENLITHEFKLTDINKAIDLFRSGTAGRIIVKMN